MRVSRHAILVAQGFRPAARIALYTLRAGISNLKIAAQAA